MVTLKDIAVRCGLSAATVSKALNGMPDVGAETAARIRDLASRLGYRPNSAARSMKTGRSMMIGMLLFLQGESVWSHCYFSRVADSVHRELEKKRVRAHAGQQQRAVHHGKLSELLPASQL